MNHNILDPVISIGTLATKVGLSVSAIRKYEDEGLIIPHRTDSGHRMFSYEDIKRTQSIQHLVKTLGFNFEGIRRLQALLPCWNLISCNHENCARSNNNQCSAKKDNTRPCWMINEGHCTGKGNECRKGIVYRFGSLFTEDIKELLHNQNNENDQSENILNLFNEKYNTIKEE